MSHQISILKEHINSIEQGGNQSSKDSFNKLFEELQQKDIIIEELSKQNSGNVNTNENQINYMEGNHVLNKENHTIIARNEIDIQQNKANELESELEITQKENNILKSHINEIENQNGENSFLKVIDSLHSSEKQIKELQQDNMIINNQKEELIQLLKELEAKTNDPVIKSSIKDFQSKK